ncbi:MAG: DegV family protein [Bacillota bacterium]|nr:DegV family protein [Bacillota bacterium]
MAVKVVTDSICAPSLQTAETLDITIVPINIHFGERIYQDLFEIEPERFYSELVSASELPTTSIPSVERYFNSFKEILNNGGSVFCLTVTSELSNSYNVALQASKELPEAEADRVLVFDSQSAGAAAGLLAIEAAKLGQQGLGLSEIKEKIECLVPNAKLVVMFDTLKYIEKSGRVGKVAAVAGDLFNVKPLIYINQGKTKFFGRARGKQQAVKLILDEFMKDTMEAKNIRVAATHANAEVGLAPIINRVKKIIADAEIEIVPFTPAMGAHAGPGIIGIAYIYDQA